MRIPYLEKLLLEEPTFKVEGIGSFWRIFKKEDIEMNYVNFERIPPHYHKKSRETFIVVEGSGIMYTGSKEEFRDLGRKTWKHIVKETRLGPGDVLHISPYKPHMLKVDGDYIEVLLVNKPPLDKTKTFDEVQLNIPEGLKL